MSAFTRITRTQLPDHDGTPIDIYADGNGFDHIGTLTFDGKGNSQLILAPGQLPYRTLQSKAKRRQ